VKFLYLLVFLGAIFGLINTEQKYGEWADAMLRADTEERREAVLKSFLG